MLHVNDDATLRIGRAGGLGCACCTLVVRGAAVGSGHSVCVRCRLCVELVAATVDGVEIYVAQVNRHVAARVGQTDGGWSVRNRAAGRALDQLVKQQIVLTALERQR